MWLLISMIKQVILSFLAHFLKIQQTLWEMYEYGGNYDIFYIIYNNW